MKGIFTIITIVLIASGIFAQAPDRMSYQAVVRNANNELVTNQPVSMQISILRGHANGIPLYVETHTPESNANGLVTLTIGTGTVVSGNFSVISWQDDQYFIKTETDPTGGTDYTISGTSQLMSVPYAMHARTAKYVTEPIVEADPVFSNSVAGSITTTDTDHWNSHTVDTDTHIDSAGIANLGYSAGSHTVDTRLTESEVDAFVSNNGYMTTETDGSVTNELQALSISSDTIFLSNANFVKLPAGFDGQYSSLSGTPTNVSTFTNDAGYLTTFTEVDGSVTNELQALSISNDTVFLSNGNYVKLPAGFDGQYSSLTGTPSNVSTFTNDAGYLTTFTEVDGSVTNELQALSISNDTVFLSNGNYIKLPAGFDGQYSSLTGAPSNVSTFTNDAGYLTTFTEVDGSVTNELQTLSISNDTIFLSNGNFAKLPAGFDGQYSSLTGTPSNVSTFTNDAGYLTTFTEVDGSVTNEIQTISRSGTTVTLSNGGGTFTDSVSNYTAGTGIDITNGVISSTGSGSAPDYAYAYIGNSSTLGAQTLTAMFPSSTYVNGLTMNGSSITLNAGKMYEVTVAFYIYNASGGHTFRMKDATNSQYLGTEIYFGQGGSDISYNMSTTNFLIKPTTNILLELEKTQGTAVNLIGKIVVKELK